MPHSKPVYFYLGIMHSAKTLPSHIYAGALNSPPALPRASTAAGSLPFQGQSVNFLPLFPAALRATRARHTGTGGTGSPPARTSLTGLAWRAFFGRRCKFGKKGGKSVGRRRAEGSSYLPSFFLPSEHKMDVEI